MSAWRYQPRVIPPRLVELCELTPRLAAALARKETLFCVWCGAQLRARRLAEVVLDLYPTGTPPRAASALDEWIDTSEARALQIAEINRIDGVHEVLARHPGLAYSDFAPGTPPGARAQGVRSEDLTRLTYADASFDLVLTSESLEHVPDLHVALREIHRVLRPGGRHVFTIPRLPGVERTFARMHVSEDGSIEEHAPRICHPGGDVGYPVFTEFGADLADLLRQHGFRVEVRYGPTSEDDLAQVFVTEKPRD